MKTCIFISRHEPTPEQRAQALLSGYNLIPGPDVDAFDMRAVRAAVHGTHNAIACVHPAIALAGIEAGKDVLVFKNVNRSAPGEPPRFECGGVQVWEAISASSAKAYTGLCPCLRDI